MVLYFLVAVTGMFVAAILVLIGFTEAMVAITSASFCCRAVCCRQVRNEGAVVYCNAGPGMVGMPAGTTPAAAPSGFGGFTGISTINMGSDGNNESGLMSQPQFVYCTFDTASANKKTMEDTNVQQPRKNKSLELNKKRVFSQ